MLDQLDAAIANTRARLLALRCAQGHWEGHLSDSALSTATAMVALSLVDSVQHAGLITGGAAWLASNQNTDGGWGDTTISKSNLSTTLLCWSALRRCAVVEAPACRKAVEQAEAWIREKVGSLEPAAIAAAVIARYGKDRTFSVPILMHCTLCGAMGEAGPAWKRVLPLPFELAALPRTWFGAIGLPVVSYALPALIAIGHARFRHVPPAWWNPLRWLRALAWPRVRPMLRSLQPSSGGYLEATPLTSFVTMALAGAGEKDHPCVGPAVEFLNRSRRANGSWPIDTNLATWGTTLSVRALAEGKDLDADEAAIVRQWLLDQQYKEVHPFTNAAPGGWAWTDLPGGVPDADDTSGALLALHQLGARGGDREVLPSIEAGIGWLLDLQNRDGGMPTFCRGWGALPFDRSTPEITAHALLAWNVWMPRLSVVLQNRIATATAAALNYLRRAQNADGSWTPLWFGNEHAPDEENRVYGAAQVVGYLCSHASLAERSADLIQSAASFLIAAGDTANAVAASQLSIEETAVTVTALCRALAADVLKASQDAAAGAAVTRHTAALIERTTGGREFPPAPIGLYFARLWYHEELYPVVWTLQALQVAQAIKDPLPRAT